MATQTIPRIDVEIREKVGGRSADHLRQKGMLPAVIYGHKRDPVHVAVNHRELVELLHNQARLLEIDVASEVEPCLVKDVQWDHLGTTIIHLDLARVDLTERVTVSIGLELVGDAVGLKEPGTILHHPLSEVEVTCLASEIPNSIRVDVRELAVDDSITLGQLELPSGVEAAGNLNAVVASVRMLAVAADEDEDLAADAAGDEPEVIGKPAAEGDEESA